MPVDSTVRARTATGAIPQQGNVCVFFFLVPHKNKKTLDREEIAKALNSRSLFSLLSRAVSLSLSLLLA